MDEEDYACDKFIPQKWRKDVCKLCFQPKRLHEKKVKKIANNPEAALPTDIVDNESSSLNVQSSSEYPLECKQQEQKLPEIIYSEKNDQAKSIVPIYGNESHETANTSLNTNVPATKNIDKDTSSSSVTETCAGGTEGDHLLETSGRSIIKVTAPLVEQDTTKPVEIPSDHAQLVSDSHDKNSNVDVVMHTSSAMPPSALETLQADSCKGDIRTEVNIQEVNIRTEAFDSEEVKQKQVHDDQEKINYPKVEKQVGLLDTTVGQNEDDDAKDVTSKLVGKEVTQDHDVKEDIVEYEEVKQKEQGLDVNSNDVSYSEEVKHKEVLQDAHVQEDTLRFEDIGHQESTLVDACLSDHTEFDSSQPVIPNDELDENAASPPALAAANYPSNIPIPPPPPPIQGSSSAPVPVQNTLPEVSATITPVDVPTGETLCLSIIAQ